jgi:hypothetical protein
LIGNEDCGQMSAWYVFGALGFYPVCPGSTEYVIGRPVFDSAVVALENEKKLIITAASPQFNYVQSLALNNKPTFRSAIEHSELISGGTLSFTLREKADSSGKFGKAVFDRPQVKTNMISFLPAPLIQAESRSFYKEQVISLSYPSAKKFKQVYTTDGKEPTKNSKVYSTPFKIDSTRVIKTKLYTDLDSSATSEAKFFKRPNNWKINIASKYNKQYTAGGDDGIIDGIYGDINWRKGEWQGYQYQDFEAVIDLTEVKDISSVMVNCLQDTRSWIIFPKKINIFISTDNKIFKAFAAAENTISAKDYTVQLKKFVAGAQVPKKARYVKIVAENFGKLPEWHEGKGDGAFIFIDEIEIK